MIVNHHSLKALREAHGYGLRDFHQATKAEDPDGKGVSLSYLSELENPSSVPKNASPRVVALLARTLGCRMPAILMPEPAEAVAS